MEPGVGFSWRAIFVRMEWTYGTTMIVALVLWGRRRQQNGLSCLELLLEKPVTQPYMKVLQPCLGNTRNDLTSPAETGYRIERAYERRNSTV